MASYFGPITKEATEIFNFCTKYLVRDDASGTDEKDSVLDKNCRAWHFDNLYVTDGCFMPTSGSGNPTHTIEANSFRVADKILEAI